jgi:hypothetical protein
MAAVQGTAWKPALHRMLASAAADLRFEALRLEAQGDAGHTVAQGNAERAARPLSVGLVLHALQIENRHFQTSLFPFRQSGWRQEKWSQSRPLKDSDDRHKLMVNISQAEMRESHRPWSAGSLANGALLSLEPAGFAGGTDGTRARPL